MSGRKETIYLEVSKMILTNTTEQTIVFAANLLAAAALKTLTKERIVILTLVYLFARAIFWAGYLGGALVGRTILRGPGFVLTITNSTFLIILNISALINLK